VQQGQEAVFVDGLKHLGPKKVPIAGSLYRDAKTNVSEICKTLGISRATFYRNIAARAA
jgi:transcriptional regulator with PAS, ATPase and Fis domain